MADLSQYTVETQYGTFVRDDELTATVTEKLFENQDLNSDLSITYINPASFFAQFPDPEYPYFFNPSLDYWLDTNGAFHGVDENDFYSVRSTLASEQSIPVVFAGAGDDAIWGGGSIDPVIIYGEAGADWLEGGPGNDTIFGGSGDDILSGDMRSIVYDIEDGYEDDDEIWGEDGNDFIAGGSGDDLIYGGNDNDRLYGNEGNDQIFGENGSDLIDGGLGDDLIYGGMDDDEIYGASGDDLIYGETGNDLIYGGNDNDSLFGDSGDDEIHGGDGNDTIEGGKGTIYSMEIILISRVTLEMMTI